MSALIWCPFPDRESARTAAHTLLDEKLVACANILGDVEAIFEWEGERSTVQEIGVLFKTNSALLEQAIQCLADIHPYDTPAILGWHCDSAHAATADWLDRLVRGKQ